MTNPSQTGSFEVVEPVIRKTYGKGGMAEALAKHLAEKIDAWPGGQPRYGAESREDMIRLTCWDWFSGGTTAEGVARQIEERLA